MSTLSVRRPLSVLAVLAMVATLLFAVAGTASAATVKPSDKATFSACPDNAGIPDAGFTDVPTGSFFDDAVNCLAYYVVTTGTTPTTYGPGEDVTRAQMAVFLYRMADKAGVVLDSTPPDAGFTDISGLSTEAQTAINSLADKGIVKGKTTTTYSPADSVWRQQMALFLQRFSDAASAPATGPGGTQADDVDGTTTNFTDLGGVTVEADTAITEVFHLGVAAGTTATTFDPLGNVNRGQMSLFLTRIAAHMNVRPAGVNIQANPVTGNDFDPADIDGVTSEVSMTLRTAGYLPIANTVADQFTFESLDNVPTTAFNTNGSCIDARVDNQPLGFGPDPCEIDAGDQATDGYGNGNVYTIETLAADADTNDLYAWTGAIGDDFDEDTTDYSMLTITPTAVADGFTFELDGDDEDGEYKYGTTATWVIQVTANGKDIAQADWEFLIDTEEGDTDDPQNVTGTTGTKMKTDASGQIVITKSFTDPDKDDDTDPPDDAYYEVDIDDYDADLTAGNNSASDDLTAVWNDDDAEATTIKVTTAAKYKENDDGESNAVTATVTDQFGNGVSGIDVCFTSTNDGAAEGVGVHAGTVADPDIIRTTNSAGQAVLGYTWDWDPGATAATSSATESYIASWETDADADPCDDRGVQDNDNVFYWVNVAEAGDTSLGIRDVLVYDAANDAMVVDNAVEYLWFQWDAGDQFNACDVALCAPVPTDKDGFDEQIAKDAATVNQEDQEAEVNSYDPDGISNMDVRPA